MKQKKILGINTHFNISNEDEFSFFSQIGFDGKISLYDYDTIIIDSYIIFNQSDVKKDMFSDGLLINYQTAFNYALVFDNLRKKLTDLLNEGKNIYLILNQNDKIYYYNDYTRYDFDYFSYLPIDFNCDICKGKEVVIEKKEPYFSFFSKIKEYISYDNIIKSSNIEKTLTTRNNDKIIGGFCNIEKGKIIFIPKFNYSGLINFYSNQKNGTRDEEFINALLELENNLSMTVEDKLPEWTNNFHILDEKKILSQISDTEKEINKLQYELETQNKELDLIRNYKYLLTATGKPLELIVKKVLKEIGFELLETEENRSDVIAKYKNMDIVA